MASPLITDKSRSVKSFVWSHYPECGFPARVNHCTVIARNGSDGRDYVYSIGGYYEGEEEEHNFRSVPIDIHRMDIDTCKWVKVNPISETKNKDIPIRKGVPPCRYGHTCVSYGDKIFVYGGFNDDDNLLSVMECFDVTHSMWLKIHATPEGCELPHGKAGHACTTNGKTMFMHGGLYSGNLYTFDMESHTWTLLPQSGEPAPKRDLHTVTYIKGKIVIFGGRSTTNYFSNVVTYDTAFYEYLLDEKKWVKVTPSGYQPQGRRSHCAVRYSDEKILYFAGYNAIIDKHFNDVFIYDSSNRHVIEVQPFGIPPIPRRRCGYCIVNNEVIFCGGTSPMETEIHGRKQVKLHDHSDTFILSLLPTLQQLAMMVVKEFQLSTGVLPIHIRQQLQTF